MIIGLLFQKHSAEHGNHEFIFISKNKIPSSFKNKINKK